VSHWFFGFTVTFSNIALQLARNGKRFLLAGGAAWLQHVAIKISLEAVSVVFELMVSLGW
jgi:hypothetical protein